jgi:hypothetical protein
VPVALKLLRRAGNGAAAEHGPVLRRLLRRPHRSLQHGQVFDVTTFGLRIRSSSRPAARLIDERGCCRRRW